MRWTSARRPKSICSASTCAGSITGSRGSTTASSTIRRCASSSWARTTGATRTSGRWLGRSTRTTTSPAVGGRTRCLAMEPCPPRGRPAPTLGGNLCCAQQVPSGPWDQRAAERRDDVLVFTSEPLTAPVEVTGPITMTLFASSTSRDTDWTAKLVDVWPDGFARNVQDGIIRARYRDASATAASPIEPGRVYEYTIDMWATSNTFLPGHRMRLEVSSSNFPRFDRNLNTGEDQATGTRMQKATQTIYHSERYPSHVVLPVIPK